MPATNEQQNIAKAFLAARQKKTPLTLYPGTMPASMAAVFLAQATNTDLSLSQELGLIAVLLLTSKGAAGVTGSGFIVLAATLASVGTVPVASIALILGVDRFMSEARALTNLVGNGVATVVVAKWENALDTVRMQRLLNQETDEEAEDPEAVLVEHLRLRHVVGVVEHPLPLRAGRIGEVLLETAHECHVLVEQGFVAGAEFR